MNEKALTYAEKAKELKERARGSAYLASTFLPGAIIAETVALANIERYPARVSAFVAAWVGYSALKEARQSIEAHYTAKALMALPEDIQNQPISSQESGAVDPEPTLSHTIK